MVYRGQHLCFKRTFRSGVIIKLKALQTRVPGFPVLVAFTPAEQGGQPPPILSRPAIHRVALFDHSVANERHDVRGARWVHCALNDGGELPNDRKSKKLHRLSLLHRLERKSV